VLKALTRGGKCVQVLLMWLPAAAVVVVTTPEVLCFLGGEGVMLQPHG